MKRQKDRISDTIFGKKAKGIKLPDIKSIREFLSRLGPHKFLNTKAENPKQILKKRSAIERKKQLILKEKTRS